MHLEYVTNSTSLHEHRSLTCLIRPLSATLAASLSVSKQPRNTQVERPACSVGSVRLTAHLFRYGDHDTPMNLKGKNGKFAYCCKTEHMDNSIRSHGHQQSWAAQNAYACLRTQSCDFMLMPYASCLLLPHNHAKQSFACMQSLPGALTCLCCLHSLLALLLDELTQISRVTYFVFIVRKMWKIDRVEILHKSI